MRHPGSLCDRGLGLRQSFCPPLRSFQLRSPRAFKQRLSRHGSLAVCEATKTFYELLDVPKTADAKTVKKAFKKMALRYHPDVNREPDAKDRFMACKTAYQTLIDEAQRKKYDRTLEGGSGGIDWDSVGEAFRRTTGSASSKPKQKEEEFYGFGDLFNDLEKDFQERQAKATDQPQSLWQEVRDIGEEFVEFLEQEIGARERKTSKAASAETKSGAEQSKRESAEERAKKAELDAQEKKRQAENEIEDMMAELRNKLKNKG